MYIVQLSVHSDAPQPGIMNKKPFSYTASGTVGVLLNISYYSVERESLSACHGGAERAGAFYRARCRADPPVLAGKSGRFVSIIVVQGLEEL